MKRVIISILSFLCVIVCSCKKETPEELLLGEWEVTVTTEQEGIIGGQVVRNTTTSVWYFTFGENGRGRMVKADDASIRTDFTYVYDKGFNSILYTMGNANNEWEIIVLTKNRFVFRSESTISGLEGKIQLKTVATSEGNKI